jgi:thymidylate synthase
MQNYHDLMAEVLADGQYKPNRTGTGTIASVGHMLKYDLSQRFEAAVTTKKLAFKSVVGELLGFFRGYQNAAQFRALGCKVWDQNANETTAWLKNPNRKGHDDLGRIYGVQWTGWRDTRYARTKAQAKALEAAGYELMAFDKKRYVRVYEREINQLEEALKTLIKDPYNRRIIVNGWRVDEFDAMCLNPCHVAYQWILMPDGKLHSTLWIRSNDLFLGHAFNAASLGVFTAIMARLAGYELGTATVFISDAHIYENHVEQTNLQLSREHYPAPKLVLSDRIKKVESLEDIAGVFERIEPEDIWLEDYESHPAIPAPMAA